jgi:hypothetical protein
MLKSLVKGFKNIDLFGRDLKFEEDGAQSFHTNTGAFLTLLLFVLVIVLGVLFGREIYERKLPVVLLSTEIVENPDIALSDIPFMFYFIDSAGKQFDDAEKYFQVVVSYVHYSKTNVVNSSYIEGFVPCDPDKFTMHKEYIRIAVEDGKNTGAIPYCVNHNDTYTVKNKLGSKNSDSLLVSINVCSDKNKCEEDAFRQTRGSIVLIKYINSFFSPKNYTNPVYYFEDTHANVVGQGVAYRNIFQLSMDLFDSDNGWILENNVKQNAIKISSIKQEGTPPEQDVNLIIFVFETNNKREYVTRSYMKVQELFAKIGGLFNAFYIIINVFILSYVKFKFRVKYTKYALGYEENNTDNKNKDKLKFSNSIKIIKDYNINKPYDKVNVSHNGSKQIIIPSNTNDGLISKLPIVNKDDHINNKKDKNTVVKEKNSIDNISRNAIENNNYVKLPSNLNFDNKNELENNSKINDSNANFEHFSYLNYIFTSFSCCSKSDNINYLHKLIISEEILKRFSLSEYLLKLSRTSNL